MLPREHYSSRREVWLQRKGASEHLFNQIGNARLGLGMAEAILAYLVFGSHVVPSWILIVPILCFLPLAIWQSRVTRQRELADRAVVFYDRALARVHDHWVGMGSAGEQFRDGSHVYADDLDVFGSGGLFDLVAETRTAAGEATLAAWFLSPAPVEDARARQLAVQELREHLDLREDLALLGPDMRAEVSVDAMSQWGSAPRVIFAPSLRWVFAILAGTGITLLVLFFAGRISLLPLAILLAVDLLLGFILRAKVSQVIDSVSPVSHGLTVLSSVLARLERQQFRSALLCQLCSQLKVAGSPASARVKALARWIDWYDSSDHALVRALRPLLLWREQIAMGLERWRLLSGAHIAEWLRTVAEFEALLSLASLAYENPDWCFPQLLEAARATLHAQNLKHPLLPKERCVGNDLALGEGGLRLLIVSGSNMSGKSTFLRAVGLNTLLAWAGGPVAADSMRISHLRLGASIRVTDSLLDNRSRFYAEIVRIRQIMDLAKPPPAALFLLDEVLSGTNSHDRQIGASAIVGKLITLGAIGLVTTHDLALAHIQGELGPLAANAHFDDQIVDGQMTFDYKLQPGVVTHSNALALMRSVGLDV